jgi:hypothetical protein
MSGRRRLRGLMLARAALLHLHGRIILMTKLDAVVRKEQ